MLRIIILCAMGSIVPSAAMAGFDVQCVNPGLCSQKVCVATRAQAGMACQTQCGNHGKPQSVKKSTCTPE